MLIGNLTRDPELRYTPSGTAVCSLGIATNRAWTTESGEKKEETEFHRVVAWNKLAELCSQLLAKGKKVFVEGRLQTRSWQSQDGTQKTSTEIVIDDMIVLDSKRVGIGEGVSPRVSVGPAETNVPLTPAGTVVSAPQPAASSDTGGNPPPEKGAENEDINPDDIPF